MEEKEIYSSLEEIGLTDKEIKIYIELLKLGEAGATRISSASGINRVTAYGILENLIKKGFVNQIIKDNKKNFFPISPEEIPKMLKQKQEKISEIVPELNSLLSIKGKRPSVTIYEGVKRVVELMDNVFSCKSGVLSYGNIKIPEKHHWFDTENLRKRRLERGVKIRGITNELPKHISKTKQWKKLNETRILKELNKITTWNYIFEDNVVMVSYEKELVGILIKNKEYSDTQRFVFEQLWKRARPVKK